MPSTSEGDEAIPVRPAGRVWGTSASRAPRPTTRAAPSCWAPSSTTSQKARQREEGSGPPSSSRSRVAPGARASCSTISGHVSDPGPGSVRSMIGRDRLEVEELVRVDVGHPARGEGARPRRPARWRPPRPRRSSRRRRRPVPGREAPPDGPASAAPARRPRYNSAAGRLRPRPLRPRRISRISTRFPRGSRVKTRGRPGICAPASTTCAPAAASRARAPARSSTCRQKWWRRAGSGGVASAMKCSSMPASRVENHTHSRCATASGSGSSLSPRTPP